MPLSVAGPRGNRIGYTAEGTIEDHIPTRPERFSLLKQPLVIAATLMAVCSNPAAARPYPGVSGLAASADSAKTAATNPAGITRFTQRAAAAELMWFSSESDWESQFSNSSREFNSKDSGDTFVPRVFYLQPVSDNFSASFTFLGAGFSDDLGDWPGRYFLKSYDSTRVSAFPSLAYRIDDQWSVAGSVAITYSSFEQERAVRNIFDPGFGDGKSELETDGIDFGFGLSTLYQHSATTRLGLTYQSEVDPSQDADSEFSGLGPNTESGDDTTGTHRRGYPRGEHLAAIGSGGNLPRVREQPRRHGRCVLGGFQRIPAVRVLLQRRHPSLSTTRTTTTFTPYPPATPGRCRRAGCWGCPPWQPTR